MRIAYVFHWNEGAESGVSKKARAHARLWEEAGHQVALFLLSRQQATGGLGGDVSPPMETAAYYRGAIDRFSAARRLAAEVRRWNPDVVYHRFDLYYSALAELGRFYPLVLEVNTDDYWEYRLGARHRYWYNRLTRKKLLRSASGTVYVTHELADRPHFARYHLRSLILGNGIELSRFDPTPAPRNAYPRAVFMGTSGQPWHGVDKIVWLAEQLPTWHFDLIGPKRVDLGESFPANVSVHGHLDQETYSRVLARADVAIGTLALHRKQMNEACPLKVREYLAYGLPVIIGYADTDFPGVVPHLLQLPNVETNVEDGVSAIQAFVHEWMGRRVPRTAIAHLDSHLKERERLSFLQRVSTEWQRGVETSSWPSADRVDLVPVVETTRIDGA